MTSWSIANAPRGLWRVAPYSTIPSYLVSFPLTPKKGSTPMRRQLLSALMVLLCVCSSVLVWSQPAPTIVDGELWIIEDAPGGAWYGLRTKEHGTLELLLDASQGDLREYWKRLKSGMRLTLEGVLREGKLIMRSPYPIDPRQQGSELIDEEFLPETLGTQSVLVLLAQYSNTGVPYTLAFAQSEMELVADILHEFSLGQLSLNMTTTPWLPIAQTNVGCTMTDTLQLADQADAAATAAGFVLSHYDRLVYGQPYNPSCPWAGLGTIGGVPQSRAWLNGLFARKTAAHELGHNLGLYHGKGLKCGAAIYHPPCTIGEYWDWINTMGITPTTPPTFSYAYPHYPANQKESLGWLGDLSAGPPILEVSSSGIYRIGPYAEMSTTPKSLKLRHLGITDSAMYFYLEARQPVGADTFLVDYPQIVNGVTLHIADPANGNTSYLLDAHPETSTWSDAALRGGGLRRGGDWLSVARAGGDVRGGHGGGRA